MTIEQPKKMVRYDLNGADMEISDTGEWVRFSDVVGLCELAASRLRQIRELADRAIQERESTGGDRITSDFRHHGLNALSEI